ncbi:hypothetical protein [Modestobacter sp. SSW1-42]|uniref:hypothetical protein n=1 Tax=Modestobacter sp. SSW1-42 TaxID=596372 RepID=UPI0039866B00
MKAESEVSRLEQAVVRWQAEAEQKQADLAALEASAGDRVLADETGTLARALAVDAQELRFLIDGARAAAEAATRQLRTARANVSRARADEVRDQLAAATRRAEAHQAKVDDLLRQLKELDNVDYTWHEPSAGPGERLEYSIPIRKVHRVEIDGLERQLAQLDADAAAHERGDQPTRLPDKVVFAELPYRSI